MKRPLPAGAVRKRVLALGAGAFRIRFRLLILLTWIIPPVFGLSFLLFIGMFTPRDMLVIVTRPIEPLYCLGSLAAAIWYLTRFVRPVSDLLEGRGGAVAAAAEDRLRRFPLHFWAVFLGYLALAPSSVILSARIYVDFAPRPVDWFRIHLVALIVSIIVGLPIFFRILDLFGRAAGALDLRRAHVTIKLKVFLIGALTPLLIGTILVQYYWTRTGFFTGETFLVWLMLEVLAIGGSLIFVQSFGQSLRPLQGVIRARRAGDQEFAELVPQSTDELGVLAGDLRDLLSDLRLHTELLGVRNRVLRSTGVLSSLRDALSTMLDACQTEVGGDVCLLSRYDESSGDLLAVAYTGVDYRHEGHFRLQRHEPSLAWTALDTGSVATVSGTRGEKCFHPTLIERFAPQSAIAAPLQAEGRDIGVLMSLSRNGNRDYTPQDKKMMEVLANEAALAIHSQLLHARRRAAEERLRQVNELAQVSLACIGDGVLITDVSGHIAFLNAVASQLTGWPLGEARGRPLSDILVLTDGFTGERPADPVQGCMGQRSSFRLAGDIRLLHRSREEQTNVEVTASAIRHRERGVVGAVLVLHDVSELRKLARRLSHQASHDALTGLINRREFEARLQRAIDGAREEERCHVLFYLDLDQFKVVNDTCGHIAGDELLKQLAANLEGKLRTTDTLGRLGGDEFGVLLEDCPLQKAQAITEKVKEAVSAFRFAWEDKVFDVGVSMGVVPIDAASGRLSDVLGAADSACYLAKEEGRNRVHVYRPDDAAAAARHGEMQWVHRLRRALEEERFQLYFQPIVPPRGSRASAGAFGEVLLRMVGETQETVLPGAFLPAAERYHLMPSIDRWVVHRVLEILAGLARSGRTAPILTVNLSGQSLSDDAFLEFVETELVCTAVSPRTLCFEITETAAIANMVRAHRFIETVRQYGCRIALDDFGTGLSSFAYLRSLPVDFLKIDGSFVRDMVERPMDRAIVESVQQIARVMGVRTIAEWVETTATLEALAAIGVDYVQGYAVGEPVPIAPFLGGEAVQAQPGQAGGASLGIGSG
jgi:diguanylate cyclase (GGDEF)-like protein/PAS domain S-box-containing protein